MITAIVTINCEMGKVDKVAEALVELDSVGEVYSVSGEFDVLAILRVLEYDSLATAV
jgi:DNA-binding Lrp family transcriptional regulator